MKRILVIALVLAATSVSTLSQALAQPSREPDRSDAKYYPPSSLFYAELTDPPSLISLIFDHPLRERIEALPPYQVAIQSPQYKRFLFGRAKVETQLQMDWREALDKLLAHRVSVAIDGQSAVAILHGKDAESMNLFSEKLLEFAKLGPNADEIRESEYRGIPVYKIQNVMYALHGARLVVTNQADMGRGVVDRILDGGPSLDDNARFQSALEARTADELAWAFVDVEFLRNANPKPFISQINNPALELLVGGIQSTLAHSPYVTTSFSGDTTAVALKGSTPFQSEWISEEREYYFGPEASGRGPAVPPTDQTLFSLSTHRDFSEMWLRAGDLFNTEINDGFAQADANLSTLFAGRDFGEDILGSFQSEVVIVATRQDFSDVLPRPTIQLPAFAAVFRLKDPDTMTRELRRITQSLIGFLNVVGAMNGQNQLEMDMEKLGDHAELVTSTFVPEADDETSTDAEIIFNFSPSVGFAGERFVVSSSAKLARELVQSKSTDAAVTADNTIATLHAGVLKEVLADNREQLIAQNMLEDGNSREEAEAIIELVLQVVDYFDAVTVRLTPTADSLEAELRLRVAP